MGLPLFQGSYIILDALDIGLDVPDIGRDLLDIRLDFLDVGCDGEEHSSDRRLKPRWLSA